MTNSILDSEWKGLFILLFVERIIPYWRAYISKTSFTSRPRNQRMCSLLKTNQSQDRLEYLNSNRVLISV